MQDLMKARYLEYVIDRSKTKTAAAKWLWSRQYLSMQIIQNGTHAVGPNRMIESRQLNA
jgi:hypothetical protein